MGQNHSTTATQGSPELQARMDASTSETSARKPFLLDEPRLNVNSSHPLALAATMQRYNNLGMLLDPKRAALFPHFPAELRIKIWKDAFTQWYNTQRRVRIVIPASPFVSDKVMCDIIDGLSDLYWNYMEGNVAGFPAEVCPLLSASYEARQIALEQFSGSLDLCSCWYRQCYQCQELELDVDSVAAHECDCKKYCGENCRSKTYFTADQIFYLPNFQSYSWQIYETLKEEAIVRHYKI